MEEGPCIIEPAFTHKYVNLYVQSLSSKLSEIAKAKTDYLMSFIGSMREEKLFAHLDVLSIAGDYHTAQKIT